ncbi:DNA-binding protein [Babesia caballi]|uniref:DNA-binding protein n=1 Tax=Babesia caballi TaxID=5871 RepID=A0AAV4LWC8_BABCB|nr:DNA-binding protein [Babesia caballi]
MPSLHVIMAIIMAPMALCRMFREIKRNETSPKILTYDQWMDICDGSYASFLEKEKEIEIEIEIESAGNTKYKNDITDAYEHFKGSVHNIKVTCEYLRELPERYPYSKVDGASDKAVELNQGAVRTGMYLLKTIIVAHSQYHVYKVVFATSKEDSDPISAVSFVEKAVGMYQVNSFLSRKTAAIVVPMALAIVAVAR